MSTFLRHNSLFLGGLGAGIVIGVGGSLIYFRFTTNVDRELRLISESISSLRKEVEELKEKVVKRKRKSPAFYGTTSSSGETDDDAYEDAYGGSDYEFHNFHDLQTEIHTQMNTRIGWEEQQEERKDDTDTFFKEVDKLFDGTDEDKLRAYEMLQNNKERFVDNVEYCWRLAKSTYQVAQIEGSRGNPDKKKQLVYASKDLSQKAVAMDEKCASAHKWFAITLGSIGDYESTQEKIKNGYIFKEHIERAIQLNPSDPSNHHLLGRWCYGVYMLSWIERKAAATLFATPPTSTAEEALTHFLEADRLNPGKWKENLLYIGKCYYQMSKYKEMTEWLDKAAAIPSVSQDDIKAEEEIQTLMKYQVR
ncbi:regulator of microtubule dynamics protein 1-like [Saccostrea echinata]|uniref:regulator of microtubule dynamics protein 1-like n=1 Tax=Saccostrea echinata TaxID=191078 RepID=UPI002A841D60|nr:regulator of microtubule dynamics protein 1-like [Saccostrea echinata]